MSLVTASDFFRCIRAISDLETLYEERGSPNIISTVNSALGGRKGWYPTLVGPGGKPCSCDVVIDDLWLEIKGAWTYPLSTQTHKPNHRFRAHLIDDPNKSALKDVRDKLPTLIGHPGVGRLGFLLICFESDKQRFPRHLIDELEDKGGLKTDWTRYDEPDWNPTGKPHLTMRAFFWEKRL